MPLSDHVDHPSRPRSDHGDPPRMEMGKRAANQPRRGIPIASDESHNSLLSPILSHLPSFTGIPSLKGLLPTSPAKQMNGDTSVSDSAKATWQEADLDDGRGRVPLLLIAAKHHALQIFTLSSSSMPDHSHVREAFPAPEEIFSLPVIRYDDKTVRTAVVGVSGSGANDHGVEHVLEARLLEKGKLCEEHGPLVACVTRQSPARKPSAHRNLALVIVSLRTAFAIRRVDLGVGSSAAIASSKKVIVVSVSHPVPTIHLLDPSSLAPTHLPITDLPINPRTGVPTFALSGRLLAFATAEPAFSSGPDSLGSLVTAKSLLRARSADQIGFPSRSSEKQKHERKTTSQGAILTSAVEIGGGVARGVWAGIKLGARAAGQARNGRLASSAPAEGSGSLADKDDMDETGDSESRSLEESSVFDEPISPLSVSSGGEWIKVVDLLPTSWRTRPPSSPADAGTSSRPTSSSSLLNAPGVTAAGTETIAHFRLPSTSPLFSSDPSQLNPRSSMIRPQPVSYLSFSPSGNQLFAAASDGRVFHIVDVHPAGALKLGVRGACKGEVWQLYELRRGSTAASVCEVTWDRECRWIGVGTGLGTIHVFPISLSGGAPSADSHVNARIPTPKQLYPLSTIIHPIIRLRPRRTTTEGTAENLSQAGAGQSPGVFTYISYRQNPFKKGVFYQDMAVYWSTTAQLELARLCVQAVIPGNENGLNGIATQKRASALTEMMLSRAGLAEQSDLSISHEVKARWMLPLGASLGSPAIIIGQVKQRKAVPVDPQRSRSLPRAEIHTYSINPRTHPPSIYLSRQMDFFGAKPIDDYSPLSMLDIEARTHRLVFRHQVEARAGSLEVNSFDEPLLCALHTVIESPPTSQIPGLPNGYPARHKWRSSVPIRHVAAGLGEGLDRVRREYVRAQHSRMHRRESEAAANQLSFEEDAVFASGDEGSSPSSGVLPESSVAEEDREEPDGWGEGWEEEYRRAVEDDGGPDDLVMGLLDEEEEERRKWEMRQKAIARQYAK